MAEAFAKSSLGTWNFAGNGEWDVIKGVRSSEALLVWEEEELATPRGAERVGELRSSETRVLSRASPSGMGSSGGWVVGGAMEVM